MKLIKQKIWVEVDCKDELPYIHKDVLCAVESGEYDSLLHLDRAVDTGKICWFGNGEDTFESNCYSVTSWLKPIEDKYILSDLELKELWNAACAFERSAKNPDFDEFVHSLNINK